MADVLSGRGVEGVGLVQAYLSGAYLYGVGLGFYRLCGHSVTQGDREPAVVIPGLGLEAVAIVESLGLVGGVIGGTVDTVGTLTVGKTAKKLFL